MKEGGLVLGVVGGVSAMKGCYDAVCPLGKRSPLFRTDWREVSVAMQSPGRKEQCR